MNAKSLYLGLTYLLLLPVGLLFPGCNPEFEVLAPEKEIFAVYGVLHPDSTEQYIRISRMFRTSEDSYIYAAENDLSVRNLRVTLVGPNTTYQAEMVTDVPKEPGLFRAAQSVYRFTIPQNVALQPGSNYVLEIRKPDDPDFLITARTQIPTKPDFLFPSPPIFNESTGLYRLPTVKLFTDNEIRFKTGTGGGFELRFYLNFWNGVEMDETFWGPTKVFVENQGCEENSDRGRFCYKIREWSVPIKFRSAFSQGPGPVSINDSITEARSPDLLPRTTRVEVTAIDSVFSNYLQINNPFGFGVNLLMDSPEYTNMSGDHIGIFGAINTDVRYFRMGICSRHFLGFVPSAAPPFCQ
ncbi:MAG: hypothetical protein AAF998_05485 [Bacteroidota bacterium]